MSERKADRFQWYVAGSTDIGGGSENQDDMFIWEKKSHNVCIIGVVDGHGRDVGKTASRSAVKCLTEYFDRHFEQLLTSPYECLVEAMKYTHNGVKEGFIETLRRQGWEVNVTAEGYLVKRKKVNTSWLCVHGGTSCSLVALVGTSLYIANVGDSSGILCSSESILNHRMIEFIGDAAIPEGASDPLLTSAREVLSPAPTNTIVLTAEHSPESPYEFLRLRSFKSRDSDRNQPALLMVYDASTHDKSHCNPVFSCNGAGRLPVVTNRGSYYKNVRREWASLVAVPPGARYQDALAFTRSLGDFHLQIYGVSHLPEVRRVDLSQLQDMVCVVLASDGIWDNYDYETISRFAMDPRRIASLQRDCKSAKGEASAVETIAKALIDANAVQAKKNFGDQADNATGIVLYISNR